jgi:hypothetical protein
VCVCVCVPRRALEALTTKHEGKAEAVGGQLRALERAAVDLLAAGEVVHEVCACVCVRVRVCVD